VGQGARSSLFPFRFLVFVFSFSCSPFRVIVFVAFPLVRVIMFVSPWIVFLFSFSQFRFIILVFAVCLFFRRLLVFRIILFVSTL